MGPFTNLSYFHCSYLSGWIEASTEVHTVCSFESLLRFFIHPQKFTENLNPDGANCNASVLLRVKCF